MENDFKEFSKIPRLDNVQMTITQKMHGTNAQILITETEIKAGSRTKWLTVDNDNFGFAKFVEDNKDIIREKLGLGRHYGEWCGPGINSGEGLKKKTLFLFNVYRFTETPVPGMIEVVPVIYKGLVADHVSTINLIAKSLQSLRLQGSFAVPGFMNPEGIVIQIGSQLIKEVFYKENPIRKEKLNLMTRKIDTSPYLCSIRLEKLLSKDERLTKEFPNTLGEIASLYIQDLIEENVITGDKDEVKAVKRALGGELFKWLKESVK